MPDCPLLTSNDRGFYPRDGICPVCGVRFTHGLAYLSAGARLLSQDEQDSIESNNLRAFLHIGIHGRDPEMRDSADIRVVRDLKGGQFDLQWCSIKCMREWFLGVFRELETIAGEIAAD